MGEDLNYRSNGSVRKIPRIKTTAVSRYVPPAFRQTQTTRASSSSSASSSASPSQLSSFGSCVSYPRSLQSLAHSRNSVSVMVVAQASSSKFTSWIAPLKGLMASDVNETKGELTSASLVVDLEEEDTSNEQWALPIVNWFATSEHVPGAELHFDARLNAQERAQLHRLVEKDMRLTACSKGQGSERFLTIAQASSGKHKTQFNLCPTQKEQEMIDGIRLRLLDSGGQSPGISELLSLIRAPGGLEQSSSVLHSHWLEVQRREQVMVELAAICARGDIGPIRDLVEKNRWALFATSKTRSPLACAVAAGHLDVVQFLLSCGVPISSFCAVHRVTMLELSKRSPIASRASMVALFSPT